MGVCKYAKTIYKKDTKNKIRFLSIAAFSDGSLHQESGIEETQNPILHSKICKGKNIGKSNETSPEEQAIKEAEALYKDKLTKGYFDTIEEAESEVVVLPMLAKSYKDEKHKIDWENDVIFAQAKLDGMRCLAHIKSLTEVILMSREGKKIENMMHIEDDLLLLAKGLNPNAFPHIIDGELYIHEEDFQSNMEAIKKYRKGITEKVQFHIYDKINPENYIGRRGSLAYIKGIAKASSLKSLDFVPSYLVQSESALKTAHKGFLACGYEGTILRLGNGMYKVNGRSSELLKYKDFQDIACKIVDIGPAKQRSTWARPVVEYNGKRFACGLKMSHTAREEMLVNKEDYIGKIAEVRYFEFSQDNIPRFPIIVGIRLDKSTSDDYLQSKIDSAKETWKDVNNSNQWVKDLREGNI
jgi:DNA ligase-1